MTFMDDVLAFLPKGVFESKGTSHGLAVSPLSAPLYAALTNARDAELRRMWDWLQSLADGDMALLMAQNFLLAALRAAHHEQYRSAVRGGAAGSWTSHPSRIFRLVGASRKSGAQKDFLRVFVADLIDQRFPFDARHTQRYAQVVAYHALGDGAVGLTQNTVSVVWKDAREDLVANPFET